MAFSLTGDLQVFSEVTCCKAMSEKSFVVCFFFTSSTPFMEEQHSV